MRRARLDAIQRSLKQPESDGRIVLPASEEGRHRMLLEEEPLQSLVNLTREAFGLDDPRADAAHLRTLTYHQLLGVYCDAMNAVVERNLANGSMDWFRALSVAEKVRLCRQPEINRDEIERLRRDYESRRDGRLDKRTIGSRDGVPLSGNPWQGCPEITPDARRRDTPEGVEWSA